MWQSHNFRFVFLILTGTLYQIVVRMRNRRRLTSDEMHVGIGMLEAGSSQRNVTEHLDVSQSVVSRMWNRYQMNGNSQHRHGGGRAKATSDIQDRYIGLLARRNPFRNATSLRNDFQNARQQVGWTLNDWTPVLFTDKSKFCIDFRSMC